MRVELGGRAAEAGFEIAADPRSRYTTEQVAAQYELDLRLWGLARLSDLYDGVNRARRARSELGETESDLQLRQELEAVEWNLAPDGGGKRSIFVPRAALDIRLASLREVVGSAPPNAPAVELAGQVQAQLEQVLLRLSPCSSVPSRPRIDRRHGGRIAKRCSTITSFAALDGSFTGGGRPLRPEYVRT